MKTNAIDTINYRGIDINIFQDEDYESPSEWDNDDCFVVYDHRNFCVERKGFDPGEIFEHTQRTKRLFYDGYYVFPLFAYIHSGVSLSLGKTRYPFTDPWDTSFKGFVLVKRQKGWSYLKDKAIKIAQSVVDEWNDCLSGNVYGYDCGFDSCWGFYGDYNKSGLIEQAKSVVDYELKTRLTTRINQVKTWIKNSVPLDKRTFVLA